MKHTNLEELLSTLRDGKGAAKVIEWQKKIEEIRLADLKLNRNITKLHEQIKFLESLNKTQEHSLVRLEEENVRMAKVNKGTRGFRFDNAVMKMKISLKHCFAHRNELHGIMYTQKIQFTTYLQELRVFYSYLHVRDHLNVLSLTFLTVFNVVNVVYNHLLYFNCEFSILFPSISITKKGSYSGINARWSSKDL